MFLFGNHFVENQNNKMKNGPCVAVTINEVETQEVDQKRILKASRYSMGSFKVPCGLAALFSIWQNHPTTTLPGCHSSTKILWGFEISERDFIDLGSSKSTKLVNVNRQKNVWLRRRQFGHLGSWTRTSSYFNNSTLVSFCTLLKAFQLLMTDAISWWS